MISRKEKHIRRGDMFYADLNPIRGSEQGGVRPVVVIQCDQGNKHSPTVIVAATTGQLNKPSLPTHILVTENNNNRLKMDTIVLLEQIRTIDRSRLGNYIGSLTDDTMRLLDAALSVSVGLGLYAERLMSEGGNHMNQCTAIDQKAMNGLPSSYNEITVGKTTIRVKSVYLGERDLKSTLEQLVVKRVVNEISAVKKA